MSKGGGRTIIVKKKKTHGHGHHGGAWKVAYADFVTAMMAFFMVMWIVGMDDNTRKAIEGYFANPVGYKKGYGTGSSPIAVGSSPVSAQNTPMRLVSHQLQQAQFEKAGSRIKSAIGNYIGTDSLAMRVEVIVGDDGLRVELVEGPQGDRFFPIGSAELRPMARHTIELVADELRLLTNPIIIEGHTDAAPYAAGHYSNWELSAARANAARRILESRSITPTRIVEVRGLADRRLRLPDAPLDPSNRRISIFLPFLDNLVRVDSSSVVS